jgi:hypothetical protein
MRFRRVFIRRWYRYAAALAVVLPLAAATAASAGASPSKQVPRGLQPQVVNVTNDQAFIFGEPEIAVNPEHPNNLVYVATKLGETPACQLSGNSNCQLIPTIFGPQPAGLINDVPGFSPNEIAVSFNRGRSWRSVPVPTLPPPVPTTGFLMGGDPAIAAGPDGTFYFSEDVVNFQTGLPPETPTIARDAGIAVSKSTDGGLTWSTPVLSGTPADRDFMTVDASTRTVYLESGAGPLGPGSTANPNAPSGTVGGRWLVASKDGVHWSTPAFLGAGISGPFISAAKGVFATGGRSTSPALCGTAPVCEVFQTTSDAGKTWSQHAVPNSSDSSDGPLVAADPTRRGHFTVAFLNAAATQLVVLRTRDFGNTWSAPTMVSEDATKTQWKPWMAYSPDGTLGLMWRTWQGSPNSSPYNVWAAFSRDGGATFTQPLEVSDGDSAAPFSRPFPTFADDFSFIALDEHHALVAWADWRPGARQGFLSVIRLGEFNRS